ncbi:hypothetical protein [Spirosoma sp. KNUC1025]|uniref:hypothetical protein n=1 Tax=Spirosoma sp. KNUC1025 TaxID=2894082 RepID=UPI001E2D53A5|nr:hypothetical protein [Spirosoma sp. KNUC1025]UFH57897.1 hypothetical protein LN737_31555 [Spirosoma sp. KNUC1025]
MDNSARQWLCFILIGLLTIMSFKLNGQPLEKMKRIEVEADPMAFIFSGYSIHVGYMINRWRIDVGTFGIKQPSFASTNQNFSVFSSGVGLKADYLLKPERGLFFGVQSDYGTDKISLKPATESTLLSGFVVGIRSGYRFMFGQSTAHYRGLYVVPWIALLYTPSASSLVQQNQVYSQSTWSVFPTLHLGYRFGSAKR